MYKFYPGFTLNVMFEGFFAYFFYMYVSGLFLKLM